MDQEQIEVNQAVSSATSFVFVFMLVVVIWALLGIAGFIMSLVCLGRSGTVLQHVIGITLAVLFGPFYWLYYMMAGSYCV